LLFTPQDACEFYLLFTPQDAHEFYLPFTPQDAHEFYLSLLSGLGDLKIYGSQKSRTALTPNSSTQPRGGGEGVSAAAPEDGEDETCPEANKMEASSTFKDQFLPGRLKGSELNPNSVNSGPSLKVKQSRYESHSIQFTPPMFFFPSVSVCLPIFPDNLYPLLPPL
jgi:hypothetical protein